MRDSRLKYLQTATFILSLLPLCLLLASYFLGQLTFNPVRAATLRTGHYALALLFLSLACTPLSLVLGVPELRRLRRPLGLYSFAYATLHLLIFVGWDYGFDWSLLGLAIVSNRYVIAGLVAYVILLILAITSIKWWVRVLGKWWSRFHRLVYVAGVMAVLHYAWIVKGDVFSLQGDVWKPIAAGGVLFVLLLMRVPPIRKQLSVVTKGGNRSATTAGH